MHDVRQKAPDALMPRSCIHSPFSSTYSWMPRLEDISLIELRLLGRDGNLGAEPANSQGLLEPKP